MDDLALESVAGRGGSGVVWLATHRDGTKLAVKLLHRPNDRQFHKEARTVAGLVHPSIVVVYDYGVLPAEVPPALEGVRPGAAWLAMERLGPSLAELANMVLSRLDALDGDLANAAARVALLPGSAGRLTEVLIAAHRGDAAALAAGLLTYASNVRSKANFDVRWNHPVFVEAQRLLPAGPDRDRVRAIAESMDEQLRSTGVIGSLPDG